MLGATLVILILIAAAWYVAKVGTVFTLVFIGAVVFMAYKRLPLIAFTLVFTVLLTAYTFVPPAYGVWKGFLWVMLAALWLFNVRPLRKALITRPFMKAYMRMLPSMSQTEKEALEAGTVWWDGELFTGKPRFEKLLASKAPQLTAEEQAFIDGPCEELCRMFDDWDITHRRADMPPRCGTSSSRRASSR
jgi:acyl-CoA dehydrogenase